MTRCLMFVLFTASVFGQAIPFPGPGTPASLGVITLDATCTGSGSAQTLACSSPMTVTAGDTITCEGFVTGFEAEQLWFNDMTNGIYDTVHSGINPASTTNWTAIGVIFNSAGGSITPQINNNSGTTRSMGLSCVAWKGTRTSGVLDPTPVLFNSANASNPTAGTAVAPLNANETVICQLVRSTAATTSAGTGFSPAGTLTAVTSSSYSNYFEYQIQTTATAVNCPYTSASQNYVDTQFALLNSSNPVGYRALMGMFGVPAGTKTNGASASLADLNTQAAGSLWSTHGNPTTAPWTQGTGSAVTYDTSVNPTGTGTIMTQGVGHAFGDAGASLHFPGANTTGSYIFTDSTSNYGTPMYVSHFLRLGSAGASNGQLCDLTQISNGVTDPNLLIQASYTSGSGIQFRFESDSGTGSSTQTAFHGADTDYWIQIHLAGVNERNHQLSIYTKSGGVWSVAETLNYDVLCGTLAVSNCTLPTPTATTTGTATSGSTALTVASGAGIANGNVVVCVGVPYLTVVASGGGTISLTISQNTTSSLSATNCNFYNKPTTLVAATNGTATSGSTALTIVAPGTGTPAVGNAVGSTDGNIVQGTIVTAVSGTSITLSQPTIGAESSGGVTFWTVSNSGNVIQFGKWSSCSFAGDVWYSGLTFDPYGTWGAFAPN